jgi:hypothetical protein
VGGFHQELRGALGTAPLQLAALVGSGGSLFVALNLGAFFAFDAALAPTGLNYGAAVLTLVVAMSMAFAGLFCGISAWAHVRRPERPGYLVGRADEQVNAVEGAHETR